MLRFFRGGGVAQFVVGGIVSAVIVAFVVEFRAGQGPTAKLKRDCVIRYDGECVDPKDYFAALGLVSPRHLEPAQLRRLGLRKKTLDGMVERELLVAKARSLGLGVGEESINAELEAGRAHVSLPAADASQVSAQLGLCRLDPLRQPLRVGYRADGAGAPRAQVGERPLRLQAVRARDSETFPTAGRASSRKCRSVSSWRSACVRWCGRGCG
ncbi:MAG: SurA N-terminal domain-containing protein [Polyangiaceae bacterium]